jgi:uncharacterized protein YkwD
MLTRATKLVLGVLLALGPLAQAGGQSQHVQRCDDEETFTSRSSLLPTHGSQVHPWKLAEWTLKGINYERLIRGLPMLQFDPTLMQAAERHSQDMISRGFFGHINPDRQNLEGRLIINGVRGWKLAAENLAINYDQLDPVTMAINGWMMSPGHKQNILEGRFKCTGIGVAYGANGSLYFTQIFLDR